MPQCYLLLNFFVPQELQNPNRESDNLHRLLYMDFKGFYSFILMLNPAL